MFKILHGIDDIDSSKLVTLNENTTRGHSLKLYKPRCLKSLRQNAFPARCIDDWNSLPNDLVCIEKLDTFKNRLDVLWRSKRFDTSAVIHLQFGAYESWDSLFPISLSPNCKLMSPNNYF